MSVKCNIVERGNPSPSRTQEVLPLHRLQRTGQPGPDHGTDRKRQHCQPRRCGRRAQKPAGPYPHGAQPRQHRRVGRFRKLLAQDQGRLGPRAKKKSAPAKSIPCGRVSSPGESSKAFWMI